MFVDKKTIRARTRLLLRQEFLIENENVNKRKDRVILLHSNNRANCSTVSPYKPNKHLSSQMLISRYSVSKLYSPNSLVAARSENKGNAAFARSLLIYKAAVVYKTIVTCLVFRHMRKKQGIA